MKLQTLHELSNLLTPCVRAESNGVSKTIVNSGGVYFTDKEGKLNLLVADTELNNNEYKDRVLPRIRRVWNEWKK